MLSHGYVWGKHEEVSEVPLFNNSNPSTATRTLNPGARGMAHVVRRLTANFFFV